MKKTGLLCYTYLFLYLPLRDCRDRASLHTKQTNDLWFQPHNLIFPWFWLVNRKSSNIWFGSIRCSICKYQAEVRLSPFYNLSKRRKLVKTKTYSFVSIKMKNNCQKKIWETLLLLWFASVFMQWASDSATPCTYLFLYNTHTLTSLNL